MLCFQDLSAHHIGEGNEIFVIIAGKNVKMTFKN